MIIIFLIISLILEAIFSTFLNTSSFFCCFIVCSLVLIYPFFKDNKLFLKYTLIIGLLYDVVFMNTYFLHILIFYFLGLAIIKINYYFVNNVYSVVYMLLIIVFLYLLMSYLIFVFFGFIELNVYRFLKQFYDTILLSIGYGVIAFLMLEKISKKYHIKKIN